MSFMTVSPPVQHLSESASMLIREYGSREGSKLDIPHWPVIIDDDMRLPARIRTNEYDTINLFSVFISPENADTKRRQWEVLKDEAETLFSKAQTVLEARKLHDERMSTLKEAKREEIRAMFPPTIRQIDGMIAMTYAVSGCYDDEGNEQDFLFSCASLFGYYGDCIRIHEVRATRHVTDTGEVVTQCRDYGVFPNMEEAQKYIRESATNGIVDWMMKMTEEDARKSGELLPWEEPFRPEDYL